MKLWPAASHHYLVCFEASSAIMALAATLDDVTMISHTTFTLLIQLTGSLGWQWSMGQ